MPPIISKLPPPAMEIDLPPLSRRRAGTIASVGSNSCGRAPRLGVYARLPPSCPYVGNFHYAPSAGNSAYSFFEGQIVPEHETERLHKIRTNPLTGNFHSRPGHYSKLHGLQNFRKRSLPISMERIIEKIKTSLTGLGSTAGDSPNRLMGEDRLGTIPYEDDSCRARVRSYEENSMPTRSQASKNGHSCEMPNDKRLSPLTMALHKKTASGITVGQHAGIGKVKGSALARTQPGSGGNKGSGLVHSHKRYKYWDTLDTNRGRFGVSVDDHAVCGAGAGGGGTGGLSGGAAEDEPCHIVHWEKHQVSCGTEEGWPPVGLGDPLIGDATATLRHLYFRERPWGVEQVGVGNGVHKGRSSGRQTTGHDHSVGLPRGQGGHYNGDMVMGRMRRGSFSEMKIKRLMVGEEGVVGGLQMGRKGSITEHGWESHTLKAQKRTAEYMQGRERLAPDMRQDMVLEKQISLAYDVNMKEVLGSGSYGTVHAAVHRSTGRQVAIKNVGKKFLFSDAEKASVQREIQIQQRMVNNHIIRLYEIYESPENLYLVQERAPCGTLEDFLYTRVRLNELDAKRAVKQILDGLVFLHGKGIVHCDLKPANILLSDVLEGELEPVVSVPDTSDSEDSREADSLAAGTAQSTVPNSLSGLVVKICDFGHARKVPDCRYFRFTGNIHKIPFHLFKHTGTDGFVAREVLMQESYGKAADMWSVGTILFKMLSGRMPWTPSRACLQRPLNMGGPIWKKVTPEAKELVGDLLEMDQYLRVDAPQALLHEWFEGIHHCAIMPTSAPGPSPTLSSNSLELSGKDSPLPLQLQQLVDEDLPARKIQDTKTTKVPEKSGVPATSLGIVSNDSSEMQTA
ncbi:unnamed protein product [Choristocarpus tenellus]